MKIRLGYVAISNALGKKVTSSSNVTYKTYSKLNSQEKRLQKLKSITSSNFDGLEKIIRYNIENDIHFYRITKDLPGGRNIHRCNVRRYPDPVRYSGQLHGTE